MTSTSTTFPSPEFLLDVADKELMDAYLGAGKAASADLQKRVTDLELHLDKLFGFEMLASARARGLPRGRHGLYFDTEQTWPLLALPRRAVMAITHFSGHCSAEGLGQACADNQDLLPFFVEAIETLAPLVFADELRRFVQQTHEYLTAYRQNSEPPAATKTLWQGDGQSLERRVYETDWTAVCFRYALDNPPWFFLQPLQGSKRLPVPDYYTIEAAWRRTEEERIRRERCEREIEADSRITDLRCAHCGMPMPAYRRTCKYCASERGRT
jgi:hypothetical protein